MDLHLLAFHGDTELVRRQILNGQGVDSLDRYGRTPLTVAAASPLAGLDMLEALLAAGADIDAVVSEDYLSTFIRPDINDNVGMDHWAHVQFSTGSSVLSYAAKYGSEDKVRLLVQRGADISFRSVHGYSVLMAATGRSGDPERDATNRVLRFLVESGAPLDCRSSYGETAITMLSRRGNLAGVKILLDAGADASPLQWNALCMAAAFGTLDEVAALIGTSQETAELDRWGQTPFLIAVQSGRIEIASLLLDHGANLMAQTKLDDSAAHFAIRRDDVAMLSWLMRRGIDLDLDDKFDYPILCRAAAQKAYRCLQLLLEDPLAADHVAYYRERAISSAESVQALQMLIQHDDEYSNVCRRLRRVLLGHDSLRIPDFSLPEYGPWLHRKLGTCNPDRMNNPFWDLMVRTRANPGPVARAWSLPERKRPAVWCFDRYGSTLNRLPDGRFVEIGGEHEDYYAPNFCIYNDVVVHHPDGSFDLYGYPREVFGATDYHTANLLGDWIYVIGCLGYPIDRRSGETPLYRLNIHTFAMEPLTTTGGPGWIHRHYARSVDDRTIEVVSGLIVNGPDAHKNTAVFQLDVITLNWSVVTPDDDERDT